MLLAIIVTTVIASALALGLRSGRRGGMIAHRPYNNRYSDASAARDEHFE